eukprot:2415738-Pleurochrysis_carterae.AAC.1
MGQLEGKNGPTENDINLERARRKEIRDTVRKQGLPMTKDEINKESEGVQYTPGKLTKGGTWGGGTEHQALAMILKIDIVIWDRRNIGKVDAHHKQLHICTPQGQTYLRNVAQVSTSQSLRTGSRHWARRRRLSRRSCERLEKQSRFTRLERCKRNHSSPRLATYSRWTWWAGSAMQR